MPDSFGPETIEQLTEVIAWAAAEELPLEVIGGGSKRALGRPVQASHGLDLSRFTGITLYEAEELVLSAGAATPLAEIQAALAERKQQLAFEPLDLGPLLGAPAGTGTIGGVLSCNLSGPRRIKAGAARDHFLGLTAVSGRGEVFKSGGRVVKNVTGYDLGKLLAGSYGTLAAMTAVTVKVLPAPEKTRTVLLLGLDDAAACQAMTRALTSMHEVSGAAHLPAAAAAGSAVSYVAEAGGGVTALRVEGPGPSVEHRCAALRRELADLGQSEELHSRNTALLWQELTMLRPLAERPELAVWRLSLPPQAGHRAVREITDGSQALYYYDWGGGLVWLGLPAQGAAAESGGESAGESAGEARVRAAVAPHGGHASLVRAPEALRAAVAVFQPLEPAKAALTLRIKDAFDPRHVLNPGRMYAGV